MDGALVGQIKSSPSIFKSKIIQVLFTLGKDLKFWVVLGIWVPHLALTSWWTLTPKNGTILDPYPTTHNGPEWISCCPLWKKLVHKCKNNCIIHKQMEWKRKALKKTLVNEVKIFFKNLNSIKRLKNEQLIKRKPRHNINKNRY